MLAARETVVPVEVGREGLGMLASRQSCAMEHIALGEAELHPHLYFELSASFRYEEKQQQTEVCFPSFQRTTVRKGELRCQVGGRLGKERCGKIRKRDVLDSALPWCATIQGMKRNLTLD